MAVACSDQPIGVDAEYCVKNEQNKEVAATQFTSEEQRLLTKAPNDRWTRVFYEIWTQKEAFVKGLGLGFRIDFLRFSVGTADEPVRCDTQLGLTEAWYTHCRSVAPNLVIALATPYQPLDVNIQEISI